MLSFETIIIIVVIISIAYFMYTLLTKQSYAIKRNEENITNNVIESSNVNNENIMDKLSKMEINLHNKIVECDKRIEDINISNNKMIEINKMNNQTVLSQMNLYNEEEFDGNNNAVLYSIDPSQFKQNVFIRKQDNDEHDDLYMSTDKNMNNVEIINENDENDENGSTSSSLTMSSNNSNKSNKSKKSKKSNKS